MRLALLLLCSCATIPGTTVAIPAQMHDGYRLAACLPLATRDTACCYYTRGDETQAVCNYGDGWRLFEPEEPRPVMAPRERPSL